MIPLRPEEYYRSLWRTLDSARKRGSHLTAYYFGYAFVPLERWEELCKMLNLGHNSSYPAIPEEISEWKRGVRERLEDL